MTSLTYVLAGREGKSHNLTPYYSGKMCSAIKITHIFRVCTEPGPQSGERFGVLKGFRAILPKKGFMFLKFLISRSALASYILCHAWALSDVGCTYNQPNHLKALL